MSKLSDYGENKLLDALLGVASHTTPAQVYMALFTSNPADDGSGTEVSGFGYAREAINFDIAALGVTQNDAAILFACTGGNWGDVTHAALFDDLTAGNLLMHGALAATKTVNDGDQLNFAIGTVVCQLQ